MAERTGSPPDGTDRSLLEGWPLDARADLVRVAGAAIALVATVATALATPAAAHGARTGAHHLLVPSVVFLGGLTVLVASLVADHRNVVDRRTADIGVVGGAVAVVLSIGLLWL